MWSQYLASFIYQAHVEWWCVSGGKYQSIAVSRLLDHTDHDHSEWDRRIHSGWFR